MGEAVSEEEATGALVQGRKCCARGFSARGVELGVEVGAERVRVSAQYGLQWRSAFCLPFLAHALGLAVSGGAPLNGRFTERLLVEYPVSSFVSGFILDTYC